MTAYYNETDPFAASWLRKLIEAGLIAPGEVDERSIEDVRPDELSGYKQCHFFAGIGVWSRALRMAGWPDNRPVWTGSCPCQPFSAAGKGLGLDDERHLWPAWQWLINERRPPVVFGEQVASRDAEPWLDLVQDDMEAMGYAVGAVPFPAAGIGAPHIRDRLYWVADAKHREQRSWRGADREDQARDESRVEPSGRGAIGGMADAEHDGRGGSESDTSKSRGNRQDFGLPDRGHSALEGQPATSPTNGIWQDADWLFCRDGRWRPVEPGTFPLAHGAAARVGRLRGYGNAINAEAAKAFIKAAMTL